MATFPSFAFSQPSNNSKNPCDDLQKPTLSQKIPHSSTQVIIIKPLEPPRALVTLCEQLNLHWKKKFKTFYATIGKNGVALEGQKKEGDLKTPAGAYPIGEAFGSTPLQLHMDFRFITADDKFIDDINHPQYNSWLYGPTTATHYENMLIDRYKMGAVVNYNMNPIVPGAGSAIFMHIWSGPNSPTAGCVAMAESSLFNVLHWLDKRQHPYIYISPE